VAEGDLAIKSEAGDGQLLISVSDTGVGLPPEEADPDLPGISLLPRITGPVMGLPISRSIIGVAWRPRIVGPPVPPGRVATLFSSLWPAAVAAHA